MTDYYEILDEILLFIRDAPSLSKEEYSHREKHIWGSDGRDISQSEKRSLFDKLIKEGYLNEDQKLTVEGFMFIQDGMYARLIADKRAETLNLIAMTRRTERNDRLIVTWAVILGVLAFAQLVLGIIGQWKDLTWFFCSYCH